MLDRTFSDALAEHLAALQNRDIKRFDRTLGNDVTVVDGAGAIVHGRDAILTAHAEWFASNDAWSFEYTVLFEREVGTAGLALIDVTYRQMPGAQAARFLLSLVFERTAGGGWQFVFDQNTGLARNAD